MAPGWGDDPQRVSAGRDQGTENHGLQPGVSRAQGPPRYPAAFLLKGLPISPWFYRKANSGSQSGGAQVLGSWLQPWDTGVQESPFSLPWGSVNIDATEYVCDMIFFKGSIVSYADSGSGGPRGCHLHSDILANPFWSHKGRLHGYSTMSMLGWQE